MTALLALFKPGRTYAAAEIYQRYEQQMQRQGRPPVHPTALGRALSRAGCRRQRIRRATGPRHNRTFSETASWTIVGQIDPADVIDPIGVLLRDLGEGIHPEEDIYARYLCLPLKGDVLSRRALMSRLSKLGYTALTDCGVRTRYIYAKNGEKW